jgi:hypothetical protein
MTKTTQTETIFSHPKPRIHPDMLAGILSTPTTTPTPHQDNALHQRDDPRGRVEAAIAFAVGRPQITTYSPVASATLEFLNQTIPGFNKSAFCAEAIEKALQTAHADIWTTISARALAEPQRRKYSTRYGCR